ncbi:hypothetical protein HDU86_002462 [Geranomyces michiganensis]|nr:hypothetical protein HDU86_002462 [Geranomyces michiganensis]
MLFHHFIFAVFSGLTALCARPKYSAFKGTFSGCTNGGPAMCIANCNFYAGLNQPVGKIITFEPVSTNGCPCHALVEVRKATPTQFPQGTLVDDDGKWSIDGNSDTLTVRFANQTSCTFTDLKPVQYQP